MISYRDKIKTQETLIKQLNQDKAEGMKIVFTNGCFDILHEGHVQYLEEAKRLGDILVVGINSDDSVRKVKGEHRPINTIDMRMGVIAGLQSVDYVVEFEELTPLNLIKLLMPNFLVKGGDWKIDQIVGSKEVICEGGEVHSLSLTEGISTSIIEEKILKKK